MVKRVKLCSRNYDFNAEVSLSIITQNKYRNQFREKLICKFSFNEIMFGSDLCGKVNVSLGWPVKNPRARFADLLFRVRPTASLYRRAAVMNVHFVRKVTSVRKKEETTL